MRLFVGNLIFTATEVELMSLFQQYGVVTSVTIMRDGLGHSRGFSYVVMPNAAQAPQPRALAAYRRGDTNSLGRGSIIALSLCGR